MPASATARRTAVTVAGIDTMRSVAIERDRRNLQSVIAERRGQSRLLVKGKIAIDLVAEGDPHHGPGLARNPGNRRRAARAPTRRRTEGIVASSIDRQASASTIEIGRLKNATKSPSDSIMPRRRLLSRMIAEHDAQHQRRHRILHFAQDEAENAEEQRDVDVEQRRGDRIGADHAQHEDDRHQIGRAAPTGLSEAGASAAGRGRTSRWSRRTPWRPPGRRSPGTRS